MSPVDQDLIGNLRRIVADHYTKDASPLLLSDFGARLRKIGLWPGGEAGRTLRQVIEAAHDPELCIVRDRNSPAYVAVTTAAAKPIVERWIERRGQATAVVPDLEALPRSVLVAFCVRV